MIRAALIQSIASEEARSQASLTAAIGIIGERPAGELSTSHPLLRAALEATKELGHEAEPSISSTDANVPLALGVPAIAIGGGGRSGNAHTVNEWFETTERYMGHEPLQFAADICSNHPTHCAPRCDRPA